MFDRYEESVLGTVIGEITTPYQFWSESEMIAKGHFRDDKEAIEWFKANHHKQFSEGVEMRIFD